VGDGYPNGMPPRGVKRGTKRARQYEHIKGSAKERGASESRAEELAARTVNRGRRSHDEPTKQDLYEQAKRVGIEGRSTMTKAQLKRALGRKRG
jgi:hypothetical protein